MKTNYSIIRYRHLVDAESKLNRLNFFCQSYFCNLLMFFFDPFVVKLINKLMRKGLKRLALGILMRVLHKLKNKIGFQPFFILKHVAFSIRQLFRIRRTILKKRKKTIFKPFFLKAHNQVAYSINHIIKCATVANSLSLHIIDALCIVLLNCFFKSKNVR